MDSRYKVSIIPQNLSKNETIIQIAEMLNHLNNITEDIFRVVNKRLELNFEKLSIFSERIDVVNEKINKLRGAKKATQVFSSCKYPATDVNREYVSIFSEANSLQAEKHVIQQRNYVSTYEPVDKLQFYHVQLPESQENTVTTEGLGEWPADLENFSDLLLFNSGKNLYTNFVLSDPLLGSCNVKEGETSDSTNIGAAPLSITERSTLTRTTTQNYFYVPSIGELPLLDVPLDLPDLPGVADDLRYFETEHGDDIIAPSATTSKQPNIPVVPFVNGTHTIAELPVANINLPDIAIDTPDVLMPSFSPEETAHTPEPPVEAKKPAEEVKGPKVIVEKIEPLEYRFGEEEENPNSRLLLDMRSDLMEAIRKAGGKKKLRSVQKPKEVKKKQVAPPSMDLMADLHSKLQMRRKGISGVRPEQQESHAPFSADSTFTKISAMIPPPQRKVNTDSDSESEDWQ